MPWQRRLLPSGSTSSGPERFRTSVASTFTIPRAIAWNSCNRSHRQATATRRDWHAIRVAWPPVGHRSPAGPHANFPVAEDGRPGAEANADPLPAIRFRPGPRNRPAPRAQDPARSQLND